MDLLPKLGRKTNLKIVGKFISGIQDLAHNSAGILEIQLPFLIKKQNKEAINIHECNDLTWI